MAPGFGIARAPATGLSALHSMAFGLAIDASQCWVTPAPRTTRFRPLVRRYRTGFPPAGFHRKVSKLCPTSHPPFPSFLAQSETPLHLAQGDPTVARNDLLLEQPVMSEFVGAQSDP